MKAIHYINQFFGQVGGEDAADAKPIFHDGIIGCSMMLNGMMPDVEVTNTIVCGDNYITNHTEEALKEIFAWLDGKEFDMFFAGPAFMAGRYGVGCGIICKAVKERYNVPVFSSMNEENPGVAEYRTEFPIFKGGRKATFMKDDLTLMAKYAEKVAKGEQLLPAADEGYFPHWFSIVTKDDAPVVGMTIITVIQSLMSLMTISPSLYKQFNTLVDLAVVTNIMPYLLSMGAVAVMMKREKCPANQVGVIKFAALVGSIYSLYALYAAGFEAMMYGSLVTFLGWTLYGIAADHLEKKSAA